MLVFLLLRLLFRRYVNVQRPAAAEKMRGAMLDYFRDDCGLKLGALVRGVPFPQRNRDVKVNRSLGPAEDGYTTSCGLRAIFLEVLHVSFLSRYFLSSK